MGEGWLSSESGFVGGIVKDRGASEGIGGHRRGSERLGRGDEEEQGGDGDLGISVVRSPIGLTLGDVQINECKSEDGATYIRVRLRKSEDEADDPSRPDATQRGRNGVGTVSEMCRESDSSRK